MNSTTLRFELGIAALLFFTAAMGCAPKSSSPQESASTVANTAISLAADAQLRLSQNPDLTLPTLLGAESMRRLPLLQNDRVLRLALSLPPKSKWTAATDGPIHSIAYSPDGESIASAGEDTVRVFAAASGKENWRVTESTWVLTAKFSPDGHNLVAGGSDNSILMLDAATGKELWRTADDDPVVSVGFSPDGRWVAAASIGTSARVFDAATGKQISLLTHGINLAEVAFSPDDVHIAVSGDNQKVHVFEAATGKEIWQITESDNVGPLAYSPDGNSLAVGGTDGSARVLDALTGKETARFSTGSQVMALQFSPDGSKVAVGNIDGTAHVFWPGGNRQSRFVTQGVIESIAFSPDNQWVAVASSGGTARVFEADTGREISRLVIPGAAAAWPYNPNSPSRVTAIAYSPDSRTIVAGSRDGAVRTFESSSRNEVFRQTAQQPFHSPSFSPDGHRIAFLTPASVPQVMDLATGKEVLLDLSRQTQSPTVIAFSPDGQWLAVGSYRGIVWVFDAATGKHVSTFTTTVDKPVGVIAFPPDHHLIAVGSEDSTVRIFDIASGKLMSTTPTYDWIDSLAFDPNGSRFATAGLHAVRVFDVRNGKQTLALSTINPVGSQSIMWAAAFNSDGKYLAFGGQNRMAQVVESATGKQITRVRLPGEVSFVSFTPDGRNIIASTPEAGHVIDIFANQEIATIPLFGPAHAVHYSENGRYVELATLDANNIRIIREPLLPADLIHSACALLDRNLTTSEWSDYLGPEIPYRGTCANLPLPRDLPASKSAVPPKP